MKPGCAGTRREGKTIKGKQTSVGFGDLSLFWMMNHALQYLFLTLLTTFEIFFRVRNRRSARDALRRPDDVFEGASRAHWELLGDNDERIFFLVIFFIVVRRRRFVRTSIP